MDEQAVRKLDDALAEVMERFRRSFLGDVIDLGEGNVLFRKRPDFAAPLVTVLGHTYGVRLILDDDASPSERDPAVEVSVNVYDDEFELGRFKEKLTEIYQWETVLKFIENFTTPDDNGVLQYGLKHLMSDVLFRVDRDVEVVEKEKKTPSKVTGRLVDTVLRLRYWLESDYVDRLVEDRALFVSWVYLYCLRPFGAAYRKSLAIDRAESYRA